MLWSRIMFWTSEDQLSSILWVILAPRNTPYLRSHVVCWDQKYLSVRKVRYKHHSSGNSGAGCQDDSKCSARGHWQKQTLCKQQNYYLLCCLWTVSSNLSVPDSSSAGSDIGDSDGISDTSELTWPPALSAKVLCRATQSEERIPQPTSLTCLSCSRGTWLLVPHRATCCGKCSCKGENWQQKLVISQWLGNNFPV